MITLASNIISTTPILIYCSTIFSYIITLNPIFLKFLVGFIIFYTILNPILKEFFKYFCEDYEIFKRPDWHPKEGCGLFPNLKMEGSKSFGMPSGHMQAITFTAIFWSLYLLHNNSNNNFVFLRILFFWILCIIVGFQRIKTGCHNLIQVVSGGIFGIILGFGYFKLVF